MEKKRVRLCARRLSAILTCNYKRHPSPGMHRHTLAEHNCIHEPLNENKCCGSVERLDCDPCIMPSPNLATICRPLEIFGRNNGHGDILFRIQIGANCKADYELTPTSLTPYLVGDLKLSQYDIRNRRKLAKLSTSNLVFNKGSTPTSLSGAIKVDTTYLTSQRFLICSSRFHFAENNYFADKKDITG
uniref:Uncharacterized protein n=1 Tax=Glossina pallidipes TaxID=7398 RepID=A0A1A9ZJ30_GLOPL